MKSLILIALAALLCSPGVLCQLNNSSSEELNASALRALVQDASIQSDTYRFLMEMEQNTQITNLTTDEKQELNTRTLSVGSMNMSAKALKMIMATLTVPEGDEENSTASAMEEYLINDTIYFKMDGNWTTMTIPGVSETWSQRNTMGQQIDLLNQSNITLIGYEMVDGQECYKLLAEINSTVVADQISNETGSILPEVSLNLSKLFSNMTMDAYYWIAIDTHQLKKSEVQESFVLDPQSLGLPTNETGRMEMSVDTSITMTFEGINKSVIVILPNEAKNAQTFFQSLIPSNKTAFDLAGNFVNATATDATENVSVNASSNDTTNATITAK